MARQPPPPLVDPVTRYPSYSLKTKSMIVRELFSSPPQFDRFIGTQQVLTKERLEIKSIFSPHPLLNKSQLLHDKRNFLGANLEGEI